MRIGKSWLLVLSLLLALSAVLAGCGSSGDSGGSQGEKTLIYGRGADSKSLDPIQVTDGESLKVTKNIYDTLVDYDDDNTEVVPGLAERWESSKDGKTWTFYLRKGVKFHDGTDFNAEAVVYNFERWMDKDHPDHKGGEFPYYGYMFGGYKGDKGHVIKSVTAVDEYTVKFELNYPQAPFLNNLAMPPFGIASPTAVKKDPEGFGQKPVGTGPFKLDSWKKNDTITLVKNEEYWQEGLPKLDKLIYRSIPENAARFSALQAGDIDIMDGLNPSDVKLVKQNQNLQIFERPGMNVAYLAFNTEKKPFNDPKVRQALNHAVNKEGIIKSFYADLAKPAKNPMPDVLWGYNDQIKDYEFDLDKAKKLLKEAGYADGFKVDFWAPTDPRPYMPDGKKIAEFIQADLAKIGVKAEIVSYDWQTYLDRTGKGEHSMALLGWIGDNGDPDNFLYVLLDKDNAKGPDAGNIAFYKNDKLHDILIKAQQVTDQEERTKLYEQAQEIIKKDAPWVPLVHVTEPMAAWNHVKGYIPHPTGSDKMLKVDIEK